MPISRLPDLAQPVSIADPSGTASPTNIRRQLLLAGLGALAGPCLPMTAFAQSTAMPLETPATASPAPARFDPNQRLGPTPWDRQDSAHYRFERLSLAAADGQRYRLWLAQPRRAAAITHPLLCLLDGNAVADTITAPMLDALAEDGQAVALVTIGPDSDLRFDVERRAYDYTPPVHMDGPTWDDEARGRRGGGADAFLAFIADRVLPAAAQVLGPTDPARRTLWGHSYGGLFALHALLRRPDIFTRYAAADPSLWWQGGFVLREAESPAPLPKDRATTRLLIMQGDSITDQRPRVQGPPNVDPAVLASRQKARASVPADSGLRLAATLNRRRGMEVEHQSYPGVAHGPMLAASLPATFLLATRA